MISERRAQTAAWGLLATLLFVAIAGGLVDVYRLFAARNWAYTVAQEAALAGASQGMDWASITTSGNIRLISTNAKTIAENLVKTEMYARGITSYVLDVRVLPATGGGVVPGFPPLPVRLGSSLGSWSSNEPAVGAYVEVPVDWLSLDRIGIVGRNVSAFAAAGVSK